MMSLHTPSVIMMAVVWERRKNEDFPHDETLQYLLILCSKVILNTLVLSFWKKNILRSLLGICSISMYVADVLLVSAVSSAWLFREHLSTSISMCFILGHGSAVYSLLPLPILIAGAFDYASYPNLNISCSTRRRVVSYCVTVVLMWASAFIYTFYNTNTQPIEIYKENLRVTVCHVYGSSVVFQFSMHLSIAVTVILFVYVKKMIGWISRANELTNTALLPDKDFSYSQVGKCGDEEIQESSPPLFVSLTLGFAVNWSPYLLMCLICALMSFVVPSYASVNLLWMACANSMLVGIAFWFRSDRTGPFIKYPDNTCSWNIYWHLSNSTLPTVDGKLPGGSCKKAHEPTIFQEI